MSTYQNAYEIASQIRRGLNEFSTAKVQATDTSGAYPNEEILRAINDAQKFLFDIVFTRNPHLFLTSASLTAVNSVLTLPADFFKLKRLENSDKAQIHPIGVEQKARSNEQASKFLYYRKGKTLVIDQSGSGETYTLWYYTRPRRLDFSKVAAAGALSLTLATSARAEADYYNNMIIEDVTADVYKEITDYSSARVATIAATPATTDYYGLVSDLPEEFHHLIPSQGLIRMRTSINSVLPPTTVDLKLFQDDLVESVRSFCGDDIDKGDVNPEDIFLDL